MSCQSASAPSGYRTPSSGHSTPMSFSRYRTVSVSTRVNLSKQDLADKILEGQERVTSIVNEVTGGRTYLSPEKGRNQ